MAPPLPVGFWSRLARFWQRDESLTVLLGLLVLFAFVLPPLTPREGPRGPIADVLLACVLVAGVSTVMRESRKAVRVLVTLTLAALPLRWIAWLHPGLEFSVWAAATETFALAVLAFVVLGMVLRPGTVNRHRLEGAVAAYLPLGLAWAGAYKWVSLVDPAAFTGAIASGTNRWIYYSLVTLTTMGYGDITPVAPIARSLAVAEAVTGQLYLAILISRLVALELQSRRER